MRERVRVREKESERERVRERERERERGALRAITVISYMHEELYSYKLTDKVAASICHGLQKISCYNIGVWF